MSLWTIIVIVVVALVVLALLGWAVWHKKREQGRVRADELRSEAANRHTDVQVQDTRAREAEAEAQRARAQADRLEAQAREERVAHDQVRAEQEDHLREADRLDPDVDHGAAEPRGRHQA